MTRHLRFRLLTLFLIVLPLTISSFIASGCAKAPPSLSPVGVSDFKATQALKALALVRDTAVTAHDTTPPLINEKTAGTIISWHRSTIIVINERQAGWEGIVVKAIEQLEQQLAASDRARFVPYLTLARTIIQEVVR